MISNPIGDVKITLYGYVKTEFKQTKLSLYNPLTP